MPVQIKGSPEGYVELYPQAVEYAETQMNILWPHDEYDVEQDVHEVLTKCTEAEQHGVLTALQLFTRYELSAGNEYWGGRVAKAYKYACIRRMASSFAMAELNSHAPFYFSLSKHLHLDSPEHQAEYKKFSALKSRMKFVEDCVKAKDDLLSLGVFSMIEGAVLYSSFAYLKSFRSNGGTKFKNLVSGINASVVDENLHAEGGAWLFRTHLEELRASGIEYDYKALEADLYAAAEQLVDHEFQIIDMMFEKGSPETITKEHLQVFVKSRVNIVLQNLGLIGMYEVAENPVASWFYSGINAVKLHDFFSTSGSEYHRGWSQKGFNVKW